MFQMDYGSKKFICGGFKDEGYFPFSSLYTRKVYEKKILSVSMMNWPRKTFCPAANLLNEDFPRFSLVLHILCESDLSKFPTGNCFMKSKAWK